MRLQGSELGGLPPLAQWSLMVAGGLLLASLLRAAALPAALLLGPLVAAALVGMNGASIRLPRLAVIGAQSVIGCMIAETITPGIVSTFAREWPLLLAVVAATLLASGALGWLLSKWGILPGTTAIWGTSPGAASSMVLMADAYGADARIVAFMQYLRVVCVAGTASLVTWLWVDTSTVERPPILWFPPIDPVSLAQTTALIIGGAVFGRRSGIPSGAILASMIVGAFLHASGLIRIELPEWLLAITYGLIGCSIGLGFTRTVLLHAFRAVPQILLSIFLLIALGAGLALVFVEFLGIAPLTAYLATSPGGMDTIAIIGASSDVDLPFVMAQQTLRFVLVVLLGPPLARLVARQLGQSTRIRP